MTTQGFINELFCQVDDQMRDVPETHRRYRVFPAGRVLRGQCSHPRLAAGDLDLG